MKSRKKPSQNAALRKTPRTNELVYALQSQPIPFEIAFWQLIELTRELERELAEIQDAHREDENATLLKTG